jgi:diadenylate cyclase
MEELARLLSGVTARDVVSALVDILIVYYVLYRVLLMIKGTRAAQVMIGLVLVGAFFFAAKQFELATVSWVLDNFISYAIILAIVVFQQEIRRGLMRLGQRSFAFARTYEETNVLDEVIRAVEHLAKHRIGALLVLEREAEVSDLIETGQIVDARVTRDLLVALFVPSRDNVLHDGAVIIRNLRVQQAGAVLPLSQNPKLDPAFGTRHRAAIGITEDSDAVALVVSEERGEITLCFHGRVARALDGVALRKALTGLFYKEKRAGRSVEAEASAAAAAAEAVAAIAQARPTAEIAAVEAPSEAKGG